MNRWLAGQAIFPIHERIRGRATYACYRQLKQSQWWPREQLHQYQLQKLRELVATALKCTDGYAELAGLDRDWLPQSLEDLRRLPLMDKSIISANLDRLVNHAVPGGPLKYHTGGSTGEPLTFYIDKRRQAYDRAARMLTHLWWGIAPGAREAYIWGSPLELSRQDRLKRFRDWLTNEQLFSAFDIDPQGISVYVNRLRRFRPDCIFGYASSIAQMCQYARRAGVLLENLPVRVVFSTAEVLYPHQRQIIAESFGGIPVVDGYGSREAGFIAHECPHGGMHIIGENVIVEFLKDGRPAQPDEDGEIVVTHLDNLAMPFIRYRTHDVGQPREGQCPCGRGSELMKMVKGRTNDFVLTRDGRWLHDAALSYIIRDIPNLRQYQFIQETIDRLRVLLVLDGTLPAGKQDQIRNGILMRVGEGIDVLVERTEHIPTAPSGKFRYVISHVTRDLRPAELADQGP